MYSALQTAIHKNDEMCRIVVNRHDGQSLFVIALSAGSLSGDKCNRNVMSSPVGQSRFSYGFRLERFSPLSKLEAPATRSENLEFNGRDRSDMNSNKSEQLRGRTVQGSVDLQ